MGHPGRRSRVSQHPHPRKARRVGHPRLCYLEVKCVAKDGPPRAKKLSKSTSPPSKSAKGGAPVLMMAAKAGPASQSKSTSPPSKSAKGGAPILMMAQGWGTRVLFGEL